MRSAVRIGIGILVCLCSTALAAKKAKIGIVAIQDSKRNSLDYSALEGRLLRLVRGAGFEAVPLRFQPAGDVDHAAREKECDYILYTDVVDVRRTTGSQVVNTVSVSHKRDIWEAEVEFRIFAMDRVQPLLATSVTGRNAKSHPGKPGTPAQPAAAPSAATASLPISESSILTEATPVEETGRQKKHKNVAVASALEREVKMVRERINHPASAESE